MPVSVVVGGQFGSEGKGKVALALARREQGQSVLVRVGGPNSGHTAYDVKGQRWILRQLPVAAIDGAHRIILPAGTYLQPQLLLDEIAALGIPREKIIISPQARVITPEHVAHEQSLGLGGAIGSTTTGTGSAVIAPLHRDRPGTGPAAVFAHQDERLRSFVRPTAGPLREALDEGRRVILEGTQGFGLSAVHSTHWPNVTTRDTTAGAFVGEAGISPVDVDDITLVIRSWPIRVSGNSGKLEAESDWATVARESGAPASIAELTSVTKKLRRVGRFEFDIVQQAIDFNRPTRLVLNHIDHIDWRCRDKTLTNRALEFIHDVERGLGRNIDWVGTSEYDFIELHQPMALRA
jgi:adenylosuccinate synthase